MLDIALIRKDPQGVKEKLATKLVKVERAATAKIRMDIISKLLAKDTQIRKFQQQVESVRAEKNRASREMPRLSENERKQLLTELRVLDARGAQLEEKLKKLQNGLEKLIGNLPNLPFPSVPIGKDASENRVVREVGKKPQFDFTPKDHLSLGEQLGIIDVSRAAKVSGSRFGYLLGDAARLEFAIVRYTLDTLLREDFTPVVPPALVSEESMWGVGHAVGPDEQEKYHLENDKLYLVGSAEHSLVPMLRDEVITGDRLPLRLVGFSSSFRREAGSYGKDTRGIIRVHQFDKVEMVSFVRPEDSIEEHKRLLSFQERLLAGLAISYRVVEICTGDLEFPAAARFDLEAYFPGEREFRETHSTSNCTDFQARRLNIRYRTKGDKPAYLHTLNGTAFAIGRTIAAIFENYQRADGKVAIPEVLRPYMGGQEFLHASLLIKP